MRALALHTNSHVYIGSYMHLPPTRTQTYMHIHKRIPYHTLAHMHMNERRNQCRIPSCVYMHVRVCVVNDLFKEAKLPG